MGVTNSLVASIQQFTQKIDNNKKPAITQMTMDFYRYTSESGVTPVKSGALRRSAMVSSVFSEGIVRWSTPYANRRNREGSITGIANWDTVTFNRYKGILLDNYQNYLLK